MNNTKEVIGEIITHFLQYKMFGNATYTFHSPTIDIHQVGDHKYIIDYNGTTIFHGYVNWPAGAKKYVVRGNIAKDIDQYLDEIDKVMFDACVEATTRVVKNVDPVAEVIEVVIEPDEVVVATRFQNIEVD